MCQESGHGSFGFSASGSHKAAVKVSARTGSHLRLSWGRTHFQANILVVRNQFLVLGAASQRPCPVPWHVGLSVKQFTSWNLTRVRVGRGCSKMEVTVVFNIVIEMISITFVVFCFLESLRLCSYSKGNGLHISVNIRKQGMIGKCFRICHCLLLQIPSSYFQGGISSYLFLANPSRNILCIYGKSHLQNTLKNDNIVYTVLSIQIFTFNYMYVLKTSPC